MPIFTDQAIVLRKWDWSETSQTVSLFCRENGLVRGVAKGAKREKGRFSGGIDPLTGGQVVAISKPGRDLATLTDWDLQDIFWPVRNDLRCHYAGLYMADLVLHAVTDADPHPRLWSALRRGLSALHEGEDPGPAVLRFLWMTIDETGYRPELNGPAAVDEAVAAVGFDPAVGGLTPDPGPDAGPTPWRVRFETIRLLRQIADAETQPEIEINFDPPAIRRASRLLAVYLTWIFDRKPPAMDAYFEITRPAPPPGPPTETAG